MENNYIDKLKEILINNHDKRIVVIGTTCTGKTTIINKIKMGLDMDEEIFPLLTQEEIKYVSKIPWTEEIGNKMDELTKTKLKVKPGTPLFGTVLLDCDLIIYLHINDELLQKRTELRNTNFNDAKNMQTKIEQELKQQPTPVITLEITE